MLKPSQKQQKILRILLEYQQISSSVAHKILSTMGDPVSLITVKRMLGQMVERNLLLLSGAGKSSRYRITTYGRLVADVNPHEYCLVEPDGRFGLQKYNFSLFPELPENLFTEAEIQLLEGATRKYHAKTLNLPHVIAQKELERLVIELSWKSSKIEGNTYTLLDTERLIREHKEAPGHDKHEARMILNHKDAFDFIRLHAQDYQTLTRSNVEAVHATLVKDLNIGLGLRTRPVGVLGSRYMPPDNQYHIKEAIGTLHDAIDRMPNPYAKALIALVGISYVQPFEDGNKRTARLMANALLIAYSCAPLSYRSIEEDDYREAMLVFYELNALAPMRALFVAQYEFAAHTYAVAPYVNN